MALALNAGTVTLTGPVSFYGERGGIVYKLGELNGGSDIPLTTPGGYAEVVQFIGTYDRLGVVPTAIVGGGSYNGDIEGIVEE
jgi:hypothetical protein